MSGLQDRLSRRLPNINFGGRPLVYRRDALTPATRLWLVVDERYDRAAVMAAYDAPTLPNHVEWSAR